MLQAIGLLVAGALVTTLVRLLVDKINKAPVKKAIDEKRLEHIYKPLSVLIESYATMSAFSDALGKLIKEHEELVSGFLKDWHSSEKRLDALRIKHADNDTPLESKVIQHVQANYNWLKKKLGHEFDKSKIMLEHLPRYQKTANFIDNIDSCVSFPLPFFLSLLLFGLYLPSRQP